MTHIHNAFSCLLILREMTIDHYYHSFSQYAVRLVPLFSKHTRRYGRYWLSYPVCHPNKLQPESKVPLLIIQMSSSASVNLLKNHRAVAASGAWAFSAPGVACRSSFFDCVSGFGVSSRFGTLGILGMLPSSAPWPDWPLFLPVKWCQPLVLPS